VTAAPREVVRRARRVVVKVGSSSLTTAAGGIDGGRVDALVDALARTRTAGADGTSREIVLVSSGAIAAGLAPLGLRAARVTSRRNRRRPASVRDCWCTATPSVSRRTV
jgi:glutamate 5-kinase